MKIKVCGLKESENINAVTALSPDYVGFIFYGPSLRFINDLPVAALNDIPAEIYKTAVFVNESGDKIADLINKYKFNAIQLHGAESPEFCKLFRNNVQVIKAFGLSSDFDFDQLEPYADNIDLFLFDTKTDTHGGSGKTFDWAILSQYKLDIPFFLSGGIGPDNLAEIKKINHPQFYGIDLNSKFETAPGIKDINKLEKAFDIIKQTQYK